ncbi:MAG: hypothetical protein INR70_02630 [Parafilimonas terrae]|nr:hypothetical protein [Parafilimonas terrae]
MMACCTASASLFRLVGTTSEAGDAIGIRYGEQHDVRLMLADGGLCRDGRADRLPFRRTSGRHRSSNTVAHYSRSNDDDACSGADIQRRSGSIGRVLGHARHAKDLWIEKR